MTNGEQSFGTILWVMIGAVAAVALGGGSWCLGGLGIILGLWPVFVLCNNFSAIERRENRQHSRRSNRYTHRCRRR